MRDLRAPAVWGLKPKPLWCLQNSSKDKFWSLNLCDFFLFVCLCVFLSPPPTRSNWAHFSNRFKLHFFIPPSASCVFLEDPPPQRLTCSKSKHFCSKPAAAWNRPERGGRRAEREYNDTSALQMDYVSISGRTQKRRGGGRECMCWMQMVLNCCLCFPSGMKHSLPLSFRRRAVAWCSG